MQLTILGCGASMGVPAVGCACAICTSTDPRNTRTRTAALLRSNNAQALIDAGPDLRQQALRAGIRELDAVLLTHAHQDHIGGIDDLRPINFAMERPLPVYGSAATLRRIRHQFDYAFDEGPSPSTRPQLLLNEIDGAPLLIGDLAITPLPIMHGDWAIYGFRCGGFAYLTDVSEIPDATYALLDGVDTVIVGSLRHRPHPLHWTVAQAVAAIERIGARRGFLTHLAHDLEYVAENAALPAHIQLAHDGLTLELG